MGECFGLNLTVEFISLLCSLFAFIYGAHVSFKNRGALFLQIITCAFGCFSLGNLYDLCYFVCMERADYSFNIGSLGYLGGMFFLFSSYYGAMDRIGDNKSKSLVKYKVYSLLLSSMNLILCTIMMYGANFNIFLFVSSVLSSAVLYFAFKHLFLPDIENGILKVMKQYNLLIISLCVIKNLYDISCLYSSALSPYLKLLLCTITIFIMPQAVKGVKKWST